MAERRVVHFSYGGKWWSLPVDKYEEPKDAIVNETNFIPDLTLWGALKLSRKPYDGKNAPKLEDFLSPAKEDAA
jgi:hypothetical protein